MRILYLTTHIADADFNELVAKAKVAPNPAGQNFHGKLLKAIKEADEVSIHSLVPNREGILSKGPDGYTYHFAPNNKYVRALLFPGRLAKKILQRENGQKVDFVFYDSLNIGLAKAAKKVAKRLGVPRIAILTDDPRNITGGKATYQKACFKLSKDADGYFALTKKLVEIFNPSKKPFLLKEGVVEESPAQPIKLEKPYVYYGGALFEKDGTKDLIEAYNRAKPAFLLVISGHGHYEEKVKEAAKENPNIRYLGQVSKEENYAYQKGAAMLINPRRYNAALDEVSVPSKVLEYLMNGVCIASTLSTPLKEAFPSDINWIEGDFSSFFASKINGQGNLTGLAPNKGKEKAVSRLGLKAIGNDLHEFLLSISPKS